MVCRSVGVDGSIGDFQRDGPEHDRYCRIGDYVFKNLYIDVKVESSIAPRDKPLRAEHCVHDINLIRPWPMMLEYELARPARHRDDLRFPRHLHSSGVKLSISPHGVTATSSNVEPFAKV